MIARRLRYRRSALVEDMPEGSPTYDGTLQAVGNGQVVGWVWDTTDPERRVPVAVMVDGERVAEGVAELEREDLVDQGVGDGAYGFELALPARLSGPGRHTIVALAGDEEAVIKPSARFWSDARPGSVWEQTTFVARAATPVTVPPAPKAASTVAVEGPDGWLFEFEDLRPVPAPAAADLARLRDRVRGLHDAFAEIRIPYLLVRVPAKHVAVGHGAPTYGESVQRLWVEPFMHLLHDEDGVEMLDLLPPLRAAARHGACFGRTDACWNARGAFFAARALLKAVSWRAPDLRPPPLSQLHLRAVPGHRGTLAQGVGPGGDPYPAEESVAPEEHRLRALRMPVEDHLVGDPQTHVRLYAKEGEKGPGLALVGDEWCEQLVPWLAESATRTTFFWTHSPPLEAIELEMPRAVIHLVRDSRLSELVGSR